VDIDLQALPSSPARPYSWSWRRSRPPALDVTRWTSILVSCGSTARSRSPGSRSMPSPPRRASRAVW